MKFLTALLATFITSQLHANWDCNIYYFNIMEHSTHEYIVQYDNDDEIISAPSLEVAQRRTLNWALSAMELHYTFQGVANWGANIDFAIKCSNTPDSEFEADYFRGPVEARTLSTAQRCFAGNIFAYDDNRGKNLLQYSPSIREDVDGDFKEAYHRVLSQIQEAVQEEYNDNMTDVIIDLSCSNVQF